MKTAATQEAEGTQNALPSAPRIKRIEELLVADPAVKLKLGKKEVSVRGRDGKTHHFAPEVIEVTKAIVESGQEPFTVKKKDVLNKAREVLKIDGEGPVSEPPQASPEVPAEAPAGGSKKVDQTLSIVALLLSASQIAKVGDNHQGASDRHERLVKLKDEYISAAKIKVSSNS